MGCEHSPGGATWSDRLFESLENLQKLLIDQYAEIAALETELEWRRKSLEEKRVYLKYFEELIKSMK